MAKTIKLGIDAGHGWENTAPNRMDSGAAVTDGGKRYLEKDVALAWAETVKFVCSQAGIACFMVRVGDRDSNPVSGRNEQAEEAGCTHFLSLHCNSAETERATGIEVFGRGKEDAAWAKAVLDAAHEATALTIRGSGVKAEGQSQHSRLAVLDFKGPGCLLEIGFLTNPGDRALMLSKAIRVAFAERVRDWLIEQR